MRGRTNIVQRLGATVNGDVITATAQENISAGDFVSYELVQAEHEYSSIIFGDFSEDYKTSGDFYFYKANSTTLYVYKNVNSVLVLKFTIIYAKIYSFAVIDLTHIAVVFGNSSTSTSKFNGVVILDVGGDTLSEVSSLALNPSSHYSPTVAMCYKNNNIYIAYERSIYNQTQRYIEFIVCKCDNFILSSYVQTTNALKFDGTYSNNVGSLLCNDGYFVLSYRYATSSAGTVYRVMVVLDININGETLEVAVNSKKNVDSDTEFAICFSNWVLTGSYQLESGSYPLFKLYSLPSLAEVTVVLRNLGFVPFGSAAIAYQSLSRINNNDFFYVYGSGLFKTNQGKGVVSCAVLHFDEESATFVLSGDILNINSEAYLYAVRGIYANGYFVAFENNTNGRIGYYLNIKRSGNAFTLPQDETKVKKYDGGVAIGFVKTGAAQGSEIQIYVPQQTQS